MQPLIAPSQAKSSCYYTAKYVSKDPFVLSSSLPFLYQAQHSLQRFGSTADDAGEDSRNLKAFIEKVLHQVNKIEVSSQQAACSMLGYDSYYSSHDFTYCFAWDAVKQFREFQCLQGETDLNTDSSTEEISDSDDSNLSEDEHETEEFGAIYSKNNFIPQSKNCGKLTIDQHGKVITLNQITKYINRGPHFQAYSLYDYSAIVRHHSKVRKRGECSKSKQDREGRKISKMYRYIGSKAARCPDKSFAQTISQKFSIPIIPGPAPPIYPGNKPVENDQLKLLSEEKKILKTSLKFGIRKQELLLSSTLYYYCHGMISLIQEILRIQSFRFYLGTKIPHGQTLQPSFVVGTSILN